MKLFECFAGLGSQHRALCNVLNNKKFKSVGISEWYISAIIGNDTIHNGPQNSFKGYDTLDRELMLNFISKFTLSMDSKTPYAHNKIKKFSYEKIRELYIALKRTKNYGSIVDIRGKDLPKKIGILTYSFPCHDVSTAGKGAGLEIGTRSGLLWEVKRILSELSLENNLPSYLLMENVKNLFSKKHIDGWNKFASFLESLGYKNTTMVLNAKDFGIPQSRERAFCISELNGTDEIIVESKGSHINIHDFLDLNNDDLIEEYKEVLPNNTKSRIEWIEKSRHINNMSHCMTITTKQDRWPNAGILFCDVNGKLVNNQNDWNINGEVAPYRFLTPREQLQLFGFKSNDYDLLKNIGMSNSRIQLMAGNSIVVPKLEAIFRAILKRIKDKKLVKDSFIPINNIEYIIDGNDNFIAVPNVA
ncbi:DNA (cytosine-5-)-methyltransferase [Aliarcobacter butzleri]|uniref:DNA (cytosine-5-)-methyltransferase n=1 Tax=Aliarcobacter butzleri TaxID=28197 RepID=UPI002B24C17A|nr:DNA (cytosine-5-)-methyltransferase [Aliarcobacter butzleri]